MMAVAERLYTPELLGLAVSLADYPADPSFPFHGSARSRSCGSTLEGDFALDSEGRIAGIGLRVRACAVGQAAAAIFAQAALGRSAEDIAAGHEALAVWLAEGGEPPDWPGISALAEARAFPGRHGAIMLPWTAAREALSSKSAEG
jgi:NifU-like protein involved in Fe-S cluster formation